LVFGSKYQAHKNAESLRGMSTRETVVNVEVCTINQRQVFAEVIFKNKRWTINVIIKLVLEGNGKKGGCEERYGCVNSQSDVVNENDKENKKGNCAVAQISNVIKENIQEFIADKLIEVKMNVRFAIIKQKANGNANYNSINKKNKKVMFKKSLQTYFNFFASFQYPSSSSNLQSAICLPWSFTFASM